MQNNDGASGRTRASANTASVTRHPLFPAIVALWFGALLGLGSLAIRTSLIEALVAAIHLDTLIPAAAPPLGMTGRILLALVLAVLGAVVGAVLASRLNRTRPAVRARNRVLPGESDVKLRARDTHPDAPARRPISALDEFGEDFDDVPALEQADQSLAVPSRRRALLSEYSHDREFRDPAPLPGEAASAMESVVLDFGSNDTARESVPPEPVATDPVLAAADDDAVWNLSALDAIADEPLAEQPVSAFAGAAWEPVSEIAPEPVTAPPAPLMALAAQAQADDEHPLLGKRLDELGHVQLIERLALSLERRRARALASRQAVAAPEPVPLRFIRAESAAEVDVPPAPAPEPEPAHIDVAAPPPPMAMPSAFRPLGFGDDSDLDDDEAVASLLPPRHFRFAPPVVAAAAHADAPERASDEVEADDGAAEDGYSSLLDLPRPVAPRPQFIRIDEPEASIDAIEPVVIFPGQAPAPVALPDALAAAPASAAASASVSAELGAGAQALPIRRFDAPSGPAAPSLVPSPASSAALDGEETERALRAALATLQRMSGAA